MIKQRISLPHPMIILKNNRRRPFTLLEAIIALGLTALLMTILAQYYLQLAYLDNSTERSLKTLYQLAYVENRLIDTLPHAVGENNDKKDFIFFTSNNASGPPFLPGSPSLFFTYDNGVDLEKAFANHVLGRLFVDESHRLILASWPSPARWEKDGPPPPIKKEVLLEGVSSLAFAFFVPPDIDRTLDAKNKKKEAQASQPSSWVGEWPFDKRQLPTIAKISFMWKDPYDRRPAPPLPVTFALPLPNSPRFILYAA